MQQRTLASLGDLPSVAKVLDFCQVWPNFKAKRESNSWFDVPPSGPCSLLLHANFLSVSNFKLLNMTNTTMVSAQIDAKGVQYQHQQHQQQEYQEERSITAKDSEVAEILMVFSKKDAGPGHLSAAIYPPYHAAAYPSAAELQKGV